MFNCNLIVLSYHRFTNHPDDYIYSRTYDQFANDLSTMEFDWITIDDGHESMMQACKIMAEKNIRAKLFISSSLIGTEGYCSWDQIKELSIFHDIENHSHNHERLTWLKDIKAIYENIWTCSVKIDLCTGRKPRYFVPPWNQADDRVQDCAERNDLILVKNRIDILNCTP